MAEGESTSTDVHDEVVGPVGPVATDGLHRVRDLDRAGRWMVAVVGLLLVLVPLVAAMANHGRWEPQGDDALIELRARDVGTPRTPLVGQPSTSGSYGEKADNVAHPGPLGFFVLAPGTRALGPITGTLLSTAAVSAASMLAVAWLLFRHLGARGGAAGAVLVGLAAFSAGAAGLTDPLSSNFGRLPLLAAAVAVWAVLCRDLRVLPLAVVFWSFAAQQHLSVLPAAGVLVAPALVGLGLAAWRSPDRDRRDALAPLGSALATGAVLWAPVLWQQATRHPGNLSALASYSGDPQRRDLGLRSALTQVANVLGPRPFLGRSSPKGWDLVAGRSVLAVLATFAVVGAILGIGAWWRRSEPKLVAAVAMAGVVALAGVATGTNIPDSPEQGRLNFFHWAFALSFFELLVFGWLLARLVPRLAPGLTHGRRITAVVAAAVVLVAVAATPLVVDRQSDRLGQPIAPRSIRSLLDQIGSAPGVRAAPGPLLVLVNGDDRYIQIGDTVGSRLSVDGYPVVFPASSKGFVHPDRLVAPCAIGSALVVTLVLGEVPAPPGRLVATVDGVPDLDRRALALLERQAQGVGVDHGADYDAALAAMPGDQGKLVGSTIDFRLPSTPEQVLLVRSNLDLLIAHPPTAPKLDHEALVALRNSFDDGAATVPATKITAHLLTRAQLARFRPDALAGC